MIPTMIAFGLLLGRWWRTALVGAAAVWPVLLLADGVLQQSGSPASTLVLASLLAVANAGLGVVVHQAVLALVRMARRALSRRRRPLHP